ncbi:MAG: hypothetical protein FD149_2131 [Rhodospirillaceae bacterium]|nr:MAG: hypothetical protein FD149_2131 [Rhodospirillaceae bacterium]
MNVSFEWGLGDKLRLLRVHDFGPGKGRGIVSAEDIRAGELVERAPVLIIPAADRAKTSWPNVTSLRGKN